MSAKGTGLEIGRHKERIHTEYTYIRG